MEFLFFWRVVLPRPERLALFDARCDKKNIVQLACLCIFSFLDSDICLQDNLILGNFSDLYIFHLEIIFFCAESGEKTATTADFWLRVSRKGEFLLAAL